MKRISVAVLMFIMVLVTLTGCGKSQNSSEITLVIAETLPSCDAFEYKEIGKPYCFYAYDIEGKLYRVLWSDFADLKEKDVVVVKYGDIVEITYDEFLSGWTPQYEVAATSVKKYSGVGHIEIKSGNNAINPFGCLLWSKVDIGDGMFCETLIDKYDVVELVKGNTNISLTNIPKIVFDEDISYSIQVNGSIKKVYLITTDTVEYLKTETTFDALSDLPDGTYYVVLEVLLSGNCDPDAPQNSYRYEDVFCLIVE